LKRINSKWMKDVAWDTFVVEGRSVDGLRRGEAGRTNTRDSGDDIILPLVSQLTRPYMDEAVSEVIRFTSTHH